jgi:hypothetical protein
MMNAQSQAMGAAGSSLQGCGSSAPHQNTILHAAVLAKIQHPRRIMDNMPYQKRIFIQLR